jgi:HSP20 family molecular chaperone IbpA
MSTSSQALTPSALELHRLLQTDGNAFSPPADVLVGDEGVTVHMDVPGCTPTTSRSSSRATC